MLKKILTILSASMLSIGAMAQELDTTNIAFSKTLDEIIINGGRATETQPMTTSTMNQREISDNKTAISVPYILNFQPGVVAEGENGLVGNTTMRIRGVDGTRVNVNINGVTLNDAESQRVYWVNLPNLAGMAESIQIQRGITAATGGSSAFGGAINLQTLNGKANPYASADLSYGSFNTRQFGITAGTGITKHGFSFDLALNSMNTDGYIRNGFADHKSLFFSATHRGKRSLVKLLAIIGKQKTGITWNGASAEALDLDPTYNSDGTYYDDFGNPYYYGNESDNYFQRHYQLYFSYQFNHAWSLHAVGDVTLGYGYYEQYKDDKKPFSKYGLLMNDSISLKKSDFITQKIMNNVAYTGNISAKYEGKHFHINFGQSYQAYTGHHFGHIIWAQDPSLYVLNNFSELTPFEWYRNKAFKQDANTFVRANWLVSDYDNIYADLQLRYVTYNMEGKDDDNLSMPLNYKNNYLFFNPKLGYNRSWATEKGLNHRLYVAAGISHREPCRADIKDTYYSGDTIKPEAMLDIEAGYQIGTKRFHVAANLYAMLYKDQLTPSGRINSASGYAFMENVDKSYRIGLELQAGFRACSWLDLEGNLALSRNKIVDYVYHANIMDEYWEDTGIVKDIKYGNTDLSFSPSVVAAGIVTFRPFAPLGQHGKNFSLQFCGKHVGKMYVDNTGREEMLQKAYFVLDCKAGYVWQLKNSKEIELQFVVNNMLNNKYRVNAWNASYYFEDPSLDYVDRYYFQQPGTNFMGRLAVRF